MKRDIQATQARGFEDKRSYVTPNGREVLCGKDKAARRLEIFERDRGRCFSCGKLVFWSQGEWHHVRGGLLRDDRLENGRWSCRRCHSRQHVQVRLRWIKA